jgi:DNA modification methylase
MSRYEIRTGDALATLQTLRSRSVQTCVTSPPYWGLRNYGVAGQLGLEASPDAYVARLVEIFREVRRTLKDDGTLWLNLGDCYATGAGKVGQSHAGGKRGKKYAEMWGYRGGHDSSPKHRQVPDSKNPNAGIPTFQPNRMPIAGLKPKDLVGMPWRVAFALQADGWYLRSEIVWHKPNAMPESVYDRPTKSHEYIFLLTKNQKYFYDYLAIKEPAVSKHSSGNKRRKIADGTESRLNTHRGRSIPWEFAGKNRDTAAQSSARRMLLNVRRRRAENGEHDLCFGTTRNKRTVWTVTTRGYKGAHFATFPPKLIEPCILAGSRPGDLVLDPFNGAATTGLVALEHGRRYLGIELNPEYVELSHERLAGFLEARRAA